MKRYWKILIFTLLLSTQALFGTQVMAASDAIYTTHFSDKALKGYDTVAYFTQGKAVQGSKQFKTTYQGAVWWFSSKKNLTAFKTQPEKYAPQYGGYCAWALGADNSLAPGSPLQWTIYNKKLYINYDKNIQDKFLVNMEDLIESADQRWPKILE
ncbi:YHS domain-containing protein [Vibrio sp. S11_S32]|uniref:YHS domain-containing (seleno)protein n=1 Tax=Vibrio sp. S11_S32 TaxID=2720225 RepID=UPI00168187E8|nr:YHS domain-containing protein [Vibrio sp. S11_S32]